MERELIFLKAADMRNVKGDRPVHHLVDTSVMRRFLIWIVMR